MAAGRIIFPGMMPAVDGAGDRIATAKAYFYVNATTTPATVYSDAALLIPLTNPVVADALGVWPAMYADTATLFTVALADGSGVPLAGQTWSNLSAAIDAALASVNLAQGAADQAAVSAASALGAPGTSATSTTNLAIAAGIKVFALAQAGKLYSAGQRIVAASAANALNQMSGVITGFADPNLTVTIDTVAGAGSHADWVISLTGNGAVSSVAGLAGAITQAALVGALDAGAAGLRAGVSVTTVVTPADVFNAQAEVALADAATIAVDFSAGFNFSVTLAGNRTLGNPSNTKVGQSGEIRIVQDGTGSRTLSFASNWVRAGGAPTLTTTAAAYDVLIYKVLGNGKVLYDLRKNPT